MKKVLGIGNSLVDVLIRINSDEILKDLGLKKGGMTLINKDQIKKILNIFNPVDTERSAGGSAANTIDGLAKLGIDCGFIGKIGRDEYGSFFQSAMQQKGIKTFLKTGEQSTGRAIVLISPDGERTFAVYLGAAVELGEEDLFAEYFTDYDILYLEGYLIPNSQLIKKSRKFARQKNQKIAVDLSSFNVVEENLTAFKSVLRESVDIVFANEEEAKAFSGISDPGEALEELSRYCEIAVVKTGEKGSLIKAEEKIYEIRAPRVACIDTTGAGDLYAAGFLYGLIQNYDYAACGRIGTMLAGRVIGVTGAKMDDNCWREIKSSLPALIK